MNELLLVAWIALSTADRFDFLGGAGSFYLTPFLVLTPLVAGSEALRLASRGITLRLSESTVHYLFWSLCLLSLALLSVLFAYDVDLAARRYALWCVQMLGPFAVAVFLAQYPDPRRILVKGAYWGMGLGFVMNAVQIAIFAAGQAVTFAEPLPFATLTPSTYGGILPRLSMQVLDQNRAGMVFIVYLFILLNWAPPTRWRKAFVTLGVLAVLSTTSRSAMLGGVSLLAVHLIQSGRLRVTGGRLVGATLSLVAVAGVLAANPRPILRFTKPLFKLVVGRLTVQKDESAGIHFQLIQYGWELATSRVKYALVGVGFGNAPVILLQFFDDDTANFHSLYTTLLVECGAPALLVGVVLMALPALWSRTYRPLLVGFAAFNVFYQTITEPIFWFVIAAAWMALGVAAEPGPAAHPRTRAEDAAHPAAV